MNGTLKPELALNEFLSTWETSAEGTISREGFVSYYHDVSAAIADDEYFESLVRNAWRIRGPQVSRSVGRAAVGHTLLMT